jgi:CRISPR-associated exonuclease Cas4
MAKLTGTLLWYWAICPREAWLMAHELNPDEDAPHLELGRFLGQRAYPRSKRREFSLPGMKLDLIEMRGDEVVVAEVKKSSRFVEAARLQLLFYLSRLEERGVTARGELRFPKERSRLSVELDEVGRTSLRKAIQGLEEVLTKELPPPPKRIPRCGPCAYCELCWGDLELEEGS